jgi:hypothetical protein
MEKDAEHSSGPLPGDLIGIGKIVNSEIAKRSYDDALSPSMRQIGYLSEDTLKTFRLFTAPLQLAAAYQDRFRAFCNRVREKVPKDRQRDAPPEIAKPVMEAFASTSDDSPLMTMFEELMARAIDINEAEKLSPDFPSIIQSLSPFQAKLIKSLTKGDHFTDVLLHSEKHLIVQRLGANFSFTDFGGENHHLTLVQDLEQKKLVTTFNSKIDKERLYPNLEVSPELQLKRMNTRLSMFGRWFASSCTSSETGPSKPR